MQTKPSNYILSLETYAHTLNAPLLLLSDKQCPQCKKALVFAGIDFVANLLKQIYEITGYCFCKNCGATLKRADPAQAQVAVDTPPSTPIVAPAVSLDDSAHFLDEATGKTCKKCNSPIIYRIDGTGKLGGHTVLMGFEFCKCGLCKVSKKQRKIGKLVKNYRPLASPLSKRPVGVDKEAS